MLGGNAHPGEGLSEAVDLVVVFRAREAGDLEEISGEILVVQALHGHDDRTGLLVVEALENVLIKPIIDVVPLDVGLARRRLQWIIDDDQAGAPAGDRARAETASRPPRAVVAKSSVDGFFAASRAAGKSDWYQALCISARVSTPSLVARSAP